MDREIDFVITWVDSNDSVWKQEKKKYMIMNQNIDVDTDDSRYRNWDFLKYWFRSVEVNAPWVRKIHFITYGHLPDFLNINHPKISIVRHKDYIPEKYLPTFSSHPIELNMFRIDGLSEQFVYFNDDMFLNQYVEKKDFFREGKPCYEALEALIQTDNVEEMYFHILLNNIAVINKHFNKRKVFKKNKWKWINFKYGKEVFRNICLFPWEKYQNLVNRHLPVPLLKSTMREVWQIEPEIMEKTSFHKFRAITDVNPYLFRYWDIMKGHFIPCRKMGTAYHVASAELKLIKKDILQANSKTICINDGAGIENFYEIKKIINGAFECRYPDKSSYEL